MLRTEESRTAEEQLAAEENFEQGESRAGEENHAAGVYIVVTDIAGLRVGAGGYCVLADAAETAAAGTVALVGFVEIADTGVLAGHVGLGDTAASLGLAALAENAVLGSSGSADTVAQDNLVVVADIAA